MNSELGRITMETISAAYGAFEVLIAVIVKSTVFWDMGSCSPV
jgi:hypothetical protein